MTPNDHALDPSTRSSASVRTTTTRTPRRSNGRSARMASPFRSWATSFPPWSSKTAATSPPPRSSSASSWPRAGSPHYLDFSAERLLPAMSKLLDQPFWLDTSDPHRMASVMQVSSRPLAHDYATPHLGQLAAPAGQSGVRLGQGDPPHRRRGHQPRAGGRRGDRPRSSRSSRSELVMQRLLPILLAATLVMAPLGAQAADLVVWWEKGYYAQEDDAVREIVAAFEQESGKQVELVFQQQEEFPQKIMAALEAGAPPDFAFGIAAVPVPLRSGRSKIGWWISRTLLATFRISSIRTRSTERCLLNAETGQKGPLRAADRSLDQPPPRLEEPPGAGGLHAWRTSRRIGTRSGRSGAIRCSRRCDVPPGATMSGAIGLPMSAEADDTRIAILPVRGRLPSGLCDPRRQTGDR